MFQLSEVKVDSQFRGSNFPPNGNLVYPLTREVIPVTARPQQYMMMHTGNVTLDDGEGHSLGDYRQHLFHTEHCRQHSPQCSGQHTF